MVAVVVQLLLLAVLACGCVVRTTSAQVGASPYASVKKSSSSNSRWPNTKAKSKTTKRHSNSNSNSNSKRNNPNQRYPQRIEHPRPMGRQQHPHPRGFETSSNWNEWERNQQHMLTFARADANWDFELTFAELATFLGSPTAVPRLPPGRTWPVQLHEYGMPSQKVKRLREFERALKAQVGRWVGVVCVPD